MSDEEPSLIGKIKDKLIRSKQEWAEQGRLITGRPDMMTTTSLSTWITSTTTFRVSMWPS